MIFHASCFPIQWFCWVIKWSIIKFYQQQKKPPNTNDEGTDVISVCILILKPIRVSRNFFLSSFFFSRKIFVCHVFQRHDVQLYSVFYIGQVNLLGNINTSVWKMYALFTAANLLSVSVWYTKDKSNLFFLFN